MMRANTRKLVISAVLLACCCSTLPWQTAAQGLDFDPRASLGASSLQQQLTEVYKNSVAWKRALASSPADACSDRAGSLCASRGGSLQATAQLLVASSPQAFDARQPGHMGGFSAVGPVKDQGDCSSCVSFAVSAGTLLAEGLCASFSSLC